MKKKKVKNQRVFTVKTIINQPLMNITLTVIKAIKKLINKSSKSFDFDDNRKKAISETLETVYRALEEKGYNPINQIVLR